MSELKVVIAEDEPLAREFLQSILSAIDHVNLVCVCKNGREAIVAVSEHEPDLLFLDIQMPRVDGFGVVQAIQADVMPLVVFVTAYDKYALKAFDAQAIDFVLKPIDKDRINRAVQRAIVLSGRTEADVGSKGKGNILFAAEAASSNRMDAVTIPEEKQGPSEDDPLADSLSIRDSGITFNIKFVDIGWADAAGDHVCIHAKGKTYVVRTTLSFLMSRLPSENFKRIHRSTMVNILRVEHAFTDGKGGLYIRLQDEVKLKVSRSYRQVIKSILEP